MIESYGDIIKKAYSNPTVAEKYYNEFFEHDIFLCERKNYIEEFMNELPSSGLILDLGCGNGQHSIYLAKNKPNCNVVGVDFSSTMLEYAEREKDNEKVSNVRFVHGNFLPFLNSLEDYAIGVLAVFCFTCLTPAEIKTALNSIYKILLPYGKIFIAVHEDLSVKNSGTGRYEVVPEIYDSTEKQYFKYFSEREMIGYLKDAKFYDYKIKRLHTSRTTEINNNKMCFIAQKRTD